MTNNSLDEEDWGEHWEPETNDLLYDRDFRGLIDCSNLCFWTPETLKDELSWAAGEGCFDRDLSAIARARQWFCAIDCKTSMPRKLCASCYRSSGLTAMKVSGTGSSYSRFISRCSHLFG
jgi:hypothetical protein